MFFNFIQFYSIDKKKDNTNTKTKFMCERIEVINQLYSMWNPLFGYVEFVGLSDILLLFSYVKQNNYMKNKYILLKKIITLIYLILFILKLRSYNLISISLKFFKY